MSSILASTTFASGPDDTLAVADPYTADSSVVINSIQEITDVDANGDPLVATGEFDPSQLPPPDEYNAEKFLADDQAALDRMVGNVSGGKNLLKSLSGNLLKGFSLGKIGKANINVILNNVPSVLKAAGVKDVTAITSLIAKGSKNGYAVTFSDPAAVVGLITSLSTQGSALGLPKVFTAMTSGVTDPLVLLNATKDIIPSALKTGNMGLFLDIASTTSASNVKSVSLLAIPTMISKYRKGSQLPDANKGNKYVEIKTGFANVDSNWNTCTRDVGPSILNSVAVAGSDDFHETMKAYVMETPSIIPASVGGVGQPTVPKENDESFLLIAKEFGMNPVDEQMITMLPTVKINVNPVYSDYQVTTNVSSFASA